MAAEAAISSVVELLGNILIQKVNFLRGVEEQARLLKDELTRMQFFLRDANKKQYQDERVRHWISEMRELALDTEDTIEMFLLNVETCVCFPRHVCRLHKVGKEIESIRARLEAIDKSRERYQIKNVGEAAESEWRSQVEARRRLAPWEKDEPVGIEDDVKELLEFILDGEKKGLSVVAVVGMGGIGKSTLARMVYNHPNITGGRRFDRRAWVVASSDFRPLETIKQLILELPTSDEVVHNKIKKLEESMNGRLYLEDKLKELLYKQLEGENYFIVLDDVWEMEHLDLLRNAFPNEEDKISRLLLTTRNMDIANQCQKSHKMKFLDPEKSWQLFLKNAFTGKSREFPTELEPIGRNIVDRCDGLPLAISVMGGLLVHTQSDIEWQEALNEMDSHLGGAESSVSAILELSYLNLPPQLKSCFMCLAFFEEDAIIPVKTLTHMIVGQGLIHRTDPARRTTMEGIARGYLDDLINRNMVQIHDFTLDNRVKTCHLHDSLHGLCLRKAKEEMGLEILKGVTRIPSESSQKPRHWVFHKDYLRTFPLDQNKHLRSLFLLGSEGYYSPHLRAPKSSCWKSFQHLKTLEFQDFHSKTLPDCFRLLVGLKQLRILNQEIKNQLHAITVPPRQLKLPSWLDDLKKLELLDMKKVRVDFPNVALKMDSLRHIHAKFACGNLSIDSWPNIETLKCIWIKDWIRCCSELRESCRVRDLGIVLDVVGCLEEQRDELKKLGASLRKMENLVKLHLSWNYLEIETFTLEFIPMHLHNLTELKLTGYMESCPSESMLPPVLTHLTLDNTNLLEDPMPELGRLPKLLYLNLKNESYMGWNLRVSRCGFPCLKALSLKKMSSLRDIIIEDGGMPRLKLLRIQGCPSLNTHKMPQHVNVLKMD